MQILVLSNDYWHPTRVAKAGLDKLATHDYSFDWIEHMGEWSAERMAAYPLVILTKANEISNEERDPWTTPEIEAAFVDYVRQGNGLLVIHSGLAGYAKTPTLRALVGGTFDHHPKQCPVTVEPQTGHLLTAGSEPFTITDEHYFVTVDDAQADIFATTVSEHGNQPGGWTRTEGEGRVCVIVPSHNVEGWVHPSFQAMLLNAIRWCTPS